VSDLRREEKLSSIRDMSGQTLVRTWSQTGALSGALMGEMKRAIAREREAWAEQMQEQMRMKSTLVFAAAIIAAAITPILFPIIPPPGAWAEPGEMIMPTTFRLSTGGQFFQNAAQPRFAFGLHFECEMCARPERFVRKFCRAVAGRAATFPTAFCQSFPRLCRHTVCTPAGTLKRETRN
jgi:hypothetical protein